MIDLYAIAREAYAAKEPKLAERAGQQAIHAAVRAVVAAIAGDNWLTTRGQDGAAKLLGRQVGTAVRRADNAERLFREAQR